MQFSNSTSYALHALVQLAGAAPGTNLGIRELASFLGVSETYLSKVMSKLRQGGLVRSAPGVSGGYELARAAASITFLDVIQVVEGQHPLYECSRFDARRHALFREQGTPEHRQGECRQGECRQGECLVQAVMTGAERELQGYLRAHTIQWVLDNSALPEALHGQG